MLGAPPVASAQITATTAAGTAAKGDIGAKTAGALPRLPGWLAPLLAIPFLSLFSTAVQSWLVGRNTRTPEDRKFMQRLIWSTGLVSTFLLALAGLDWWQFRQARNLVSCGA